MRNPILQLIQNAPATRPITPSSASISRTRIPFPTPPMDGLQESSPILSIFCVRSKVRAPVRAAPVAASQPAWPPPMTQTKIGIKHDCEEFTERCVWGGAIQRTIIGIGIRLGRKGAPLEESAPACASCKTEHKSRNLRQKTKKTSLKLPQCSFNT